MTTPSLTAVAIKNRFGRLQGYGDCYRCGDTWNWKPKHSTPITQSKACFPLCEECWSALSPEERLPYYAQLWAAWLSNPEMGANRVEVLDEWPLIRTAVMEGQ